MENGKPASISGLQGKQGCRMIAVLSLIFETPAYLFTGALGRNIAALMPHNG